MKEAVSELNSSLEGIIGRMDTSLDQLKVDQPTLYIIDTCNGITMYINCTCTV